MLKFFSKRLNNKKGFTLIELIVVIAILAILALIAIPRMGSFRSDAAVSSHNANVRTLESAATMYLAQEGAGTVQNWDKDGGGWDKYMADWPKVPKGVKDKDKNDADVKGDYTVNIDANGIVTVSPALVPDRSTN